MELNKYIDHTNLKAYATKNDIEKLCEEAIKYGFESVCINPYYIKYAKRLLKNSNIHVGTVIGFPLGSAITKTKVFEARKAIADGADELDMVINISALKDKDYDYVENEIKEIVEIAKGRSVKVIIEVSYLTDDEIIMMCEICKRNFVHFIKTSTGLTEGATVEHIQLIKDHIGDLVMIKASGGIKTYDDAMAMIEAGAMRIGTSDSVEIMEGKI